jgi:hypothetical protein
MDEEIREVVCGFVMGWRGFVEDWGIKRSGDLDSGVRRIT